MSIPSRKICLLGAAGVGKTSLVRRFAYNVVEPLYVPSAGVTVSSKTIVVNRAGVPTAVTLLLWDPTSPSLASLPAAGFLGGADAVLLVCDRTIGEDETHLAAYLEPIQRYAATAQLAVCVNKMDLPCADSSLVSAAHLADVLQAPLFQTSATHGRAVDAAFRTLASLTLERPNPTESDR